MRIIRFACVGASGTGLNLALMYLFTDIAKLSYFWSCVIAFIIVVTSNYILNTVWTFKQKYSIVAWVKYGFTSLFSLGINELALFVGTHLLGFWYIYSTIVGVLIGFIVNYSISRSYIWKSKKQTELV